MHLHVGDGRNLLVIDQHKFDVITIELSSIWFAGAANLYNREFYEVAAQKLNEGGILQQWIQLHHTTPRDMASQMATARSVFPHAAFFAEGHGVLLLSAAPLHVNAHAAINFANLYLIDDTNGRFHRQRLRSGGNTTREARVDRRQFAFRVRDATQQYGVHRVRHGRNRKSAHAGYCATSSDDGTSLRRRIHIEHGEMLGRIADRSWLRMFSPVTSHPLLEDVARDSPLMPIDDP